jgi:hypothetical protein
MYFRLSRLFAVTALGWFAAVAGCSSNAGQPMTMTPDAAPSGAEAGTDGGAASLTGTVKDRAGTAVAGAKVAVGAASVFSDPQGKYTLPGVPAGMAAVKVTRDWFTPLDTTATVAAAGATTLDITLDEVPLKLEPADRTLAEAYAMTFDWSRQTVSISIVAKPTRRDFDNAVYFHNPALYRNTASEAPLTPAPMPEIMGTSARNITFPVKAGANQGQEALELATIVDAIKDTPLGPSEPAEFMLWTPMTSWLSEWDAAKAADLKAVGVAVRQQAWGGNSLRPQEIEKVYLDVASRTLWAKVIFAGFVQLGPGINDDDGDGQKEIYAKIPAVHYPGGIIDKLITEYGKTTFTTHGLSKEVNKSLNELYSTTAAQVERYIGQPFEVPGAGTIMYPFVVLRHSGGQKNVILVAP